MKSKEKCLYWLNLTDECELGYSKECCDLGSCDDYIEIN